VLTTDAKKHIPLFLLLWFLADLLVTAVGYLIFGTSIAAHLGIKVFATLPIGLFLYWYFVVERTNVSLHT